MKDTKDPLDRLELEPDADLFKRLVRKVVNAPKEEVDKRIEADKGKPNNRKKYVFRPE